MNYQRQKEVELQDALLLRYWHIRCQGTGSEHRFERILRLSGATDVERPEVLT